MSDLVVNVRQIGNYPLRTSVDPGDLVLLQTGGLGGPYSSATAQTLVETALENGGNLAVGVVPPADAGAAQIFTETYVIDPNGYGLKFNGYQDADGYWRYWRSGDAMEIDFDISVGLNFFSAVAGAGGDFIPGWTRLMNLAPDGRLSLLLNTVTLPYDAALSMDAVPLQQLDSKLSDAVQKVTTDLFNAMLNIYLPLAGGAMRGPLTLQGDATAPFMPVTLQQMEVALAAIGSQVDYMPIGGGTFTGPVLMWRNAQEPMEPVTLSQLEAMLAGGPAVTIHDDLPDTVTSGQPIPQGTWIAVGGPATGTSWQNGPAAQFVASDGLSVYATGNWTLYPVEGLGGGGGGAGGDTSMLMPKSGGQFTGPVTMSGVAALAMQPVVLQQMQDALALYTMTSNLPTLINQQVTQQLTGFVPLTGAQMEGDLRVLEPQSPDSATPKFYVDDLLANLRLFMGTWSVALNAPNISAGSTTGSGEYYIAVTMNPNNPEQAPQGVPGIGGQMVNNGDVIIWDGNNNRWELIRGGALTVAEADSFYVRRDGSTMTGPLILNGNADVPLRAVPLQQLNSTVAGLVTASQFTSALANYLPLAGGQHMTGFFNLAGNATTALQAVTLQQMNAALAGLDPQMPDLSGYLLISGGVMTGPLLLARQATANMEAVPLQQLNTAVNNIILSGAYLPTQGGVMTGPITLAADASQPLQPVTLQQLQAAIANFISAGYFMPIAGGGFTGPIWLSQWATDSGMPVALGQMNQALTNYVTNAQLGNYLPLSGGTLYGALAVNAWLWTGGDCNISGNFGCSNQVWAGAQVIGSGGVQAGGAGVYSQWIGQWFVIQRDWIDMNIYINGGYNDNAVRGNNSLVTSVALSGGGPTGAYFVAYDHGPTAFLFWADAVSDERYKQNIKPTGVDALKLINEIKITEFDVDEKIADYCTNVGKVRGAPAEKCPDRHVRIGMVAQDVQPHVPEAVHARPPVHLPNAVPEAPHVEGRRWRDRDGTERDGHVPEPWQPLREAGDAQASPLAEASLLLNYQAFVPYLLRAVQQLSAEVEALKGRVH